MSQRHRLAGSTLPVCPTPHSAGWPQTRPSFPGSLGPVIHGPWSPDVSKVLQVSRSKMRLSISPQSFYLPPSPLPCPMHHSQAGWPRTPRGMQKWPGVPEPPDQTQHRNLAASWHQETGMRLGNRKPGWHPGTRLRAQQPWALPPSLPLLTYSWRAGNGRDFKIFHLSAPKIRGEIRGHAPLGLLQGSIQSV